MSRKYSRFLNKGSRAIRILLYSHFIPHLPLYYPDHFRVPPAKGASPVSQGLPTNKKRPKP